MGMAFRIGEILWPSASGMMVENLVLGIDIGGSSVKGGIVDVNAGRSWVKDAP